MTEPSNVVLLAWPEFVAIYFNMEVYINDSSLKQFGENKKKHLQIV